MGLFRDFCVRLPVSPPRDVIAGPAIRLACPGNGPYLTAMVQSASTQDSIQSSTRDSIQGMMAIRPQGNAAGRVASAIVWTAVLLAALALLGSLSLWFHYGTTVFFEMITAGISACF